MRVRSLKRTLATGLCLALLITFFIDLAILVVPIYDLQLYDRVFMSRNMSTLTLLSVACGVGLLFFAALEYLRSACFIALSGLLARHLHGRALDRGIRYAAAGDKRVGPQLVRDLSELQTFLASGAVAVPLDAICVPMFLVILFVLHPAFGFLAIVGIATLVLIGCVAEWTVEPSLHSAHSRRRAGDHALSRSVSDPELTEGLGMLPAIARRWCDRYAMSLVGINHAATRVQLATSLSRMVRLIVQAGVMMLGAVLIIRGDTTPGSLMGANLLVNKSLIPFDHLVESCRSWFKARAAWRNVSQLTANEDAPPFSPVPEQSGPQGLVIQQLSFRLPDGPTLLEDITLRIAPGTFVLLSGPNGSGKTTLLRLLAGVASPSAGHVLLNGMPLRGGADIGYLPQSVSLMDGTLIENIGRMTPDLGRVVETARQANLHEPIGRMPRGYETHLTGDGNPLSGGMRQRVGLARALYGAPRLLLLDEPDANLDGEGTKALLSAVRERCEHGAITIVISHRPAMRQAADIVVEIQSGKIVSPSISLTECSLQTA